MNESYAAPAAHRRRKTPLWLLLFLDLLLAGALLCVFALFHHVIPYTRGAASGPIGVIQRPVSEPSGPVALAQDGESGGSFTTVEAENLHAVLRLIAPKGAEA